jgi:hypothetical protein
MSRDFIFCHHLPRVITLYSRATARVKQSQPLRMSGVASGSPVVGRSARAHSACPGSPGRLGFPEELF